MGRGDQAMDRVATPVMLAPDPGPFFEASTLRLYGLHSSRQLRRIVYKKCIQQELVSHQVKHARTTTNFHTFCSHGGQS
jgi:hypothetical protein